MGKNFDLCHYPGVTDSGFLSVVVLFFPSLSGLHREAERRNPGCGDCGVWLGVHLANGDHRQHDAWRPRREIGEAEYRGPDHVHKWHQPGGLASVHLPEHY